MIPWDPEPIVLLGCPLLLGVFLVLNRHQPWRSFWLRAAAFTAGDVVLLLALVSPLDTLGDSYLFSAHMVQHLLLLECVPPLLILGLPPGLLLPRWMRPWERHLRRPLLAWWLAFATLALWHLPSLYDAAVRHDAIHAVEHLCFLITATIFWWPILAPCPQSRIPPWQAIYYLYSRMAANVLLGTVVASVPVGTYTVYNTGADPDHLLHLIRVSWGLTPVLDQRLGGILMWIPSLAINAAAVPLLLVLWHSYNRRATPAAVPALAADGR